MGGASTGTGGGEKPTRAVEARLFTKHGFDIVMITNQTKGVVSELEGPDANAQANRPGQNENGVKHQLKDSILVNKRAQALYAAREEESTWLKRKNLNTCGSWGGLAHIYIYVLSLFNCFLIKNSCYFKLFVSAFLIMSFTLFGTIHLFDSRPGLLC